MVHTGERRKSPVEWVLDVMNEKNYNECIICRKQKQEHGYYPRVRDGIKRGSLKKKMGTEKHTHMFLCLEVLCNHDGELDMPKR